MPEAEGLAHAHAMGWRLVSVGNDSEYSMWPPNERPPAQCLKYHLGQVEAHPAPGQDCRCGYYGYESLEACLLAYNFTHAAPEVIGQVELTGQVVHAQAAYRAEFAYPTRLIVLDRPWRDIARYARELGAYGVPVEIRSHPEGR